MSPDDPRPIFYYLLRDQRGDVRGVIRSYEHYGSESRIGAYQIEETNQAQVETLEVFGAVDSFDIDEHKDRVTKPVWGYGNEIKSSSK